MFRSLHEEKVAQWKFGVVPGTRWLRSVGIALLVACIAASLVRQGPPYTHQFFFCDFANFYSGSRVWLDGGDPYQIDQVYRAWQGSGHGKWLSVPEKELETQDVWAAVYPPATIAVLTPVAAMRAVPAHVLWLALNVAVFIAACMALWSLGRIEDRQQRWLVALLVFGSAAGIATFESGQLALVAGCLLIIGVWALRRSRPLTAGLLIGLAACFKIQIGLPVILYYALARRWRTAALAASIFVAASLIGIIPLEIRGIHWFTEFSHNAAQTLAPAGVNDPMPGARFRHNMVNLQTILDVFIHNSTTVEVVSIGIVLCGALWLLLLMQVTPRADRSIPLLSLAIVMSLLPIYHRLYDALPLALLLIWSLKRLHTPLRPYAITTLIFLCEFLIPIDFVPIVAKRLHFPASLTETPWWQGIIIPHHAWGMVFLTAWLLYMCSVLAPRQHEVQRQRLTPSYPPRRVEWAVWMKLSHHPKRLQH